MFWSDALGLLLHIYDHLLCIFCVSFTAPSLVKCYWVHYYTFIILGHVLLGLLLHIYHPWSCVIALTLLHIIIVGHVLLHWHHFTFVNLCLVFCVLTKLLLLVYHEDPHMKKIPKYIDLINVTSSSSSLSRQFVHGNTPVP